MNIYEGLTAYKTYLAIKNHFNTSYDYFKYNGKLKVSDDSFLKRRDKFFFAKLERNYRKQELVYFFVANFLSNDSNWAGSLVGAESERNYVEWRKCIESLKYNFKLDCESIQNEIERRGIQFDDVFKAVDSNHPLLLKMLLGKRISIESFTIMDMIFNFTKQWQKHLKDDIMYKGIKVKVDKYKPFLQVDIKPYKDIMKQVFYA